MALNSPIEETGVSKLQLTQSISELLNENTSLRHRGKKYIPDVLPPILNTVNGKNTGYYNGEGTFLQIGPHIYGGEVQDIQIVENKAVSSFLGVRANNDFLVDDGTGEANIVISLMFSGADHIQESLIPLIALFRIAPITSIKNEMITSALLNKFTEDDVSTGEQLALDEFDAIADESNKFYQKSKIDSEFFDNTDTIDTDIRANNNTVTEELFLDIKHNFPYLPMFGKWPTYAAFVINKLNLQDNYEDRIKDKLFAERVIQSLAKKTMPVNDYDYVPVAFSYIEIQTHSELSDTVTAQLIFKRIDVDSYTNGGLEYRTIKDTPTYNGRNAYWLRRALDIYIDRYLPKSWTFGSSNESLSRPVSLKFAGDDIVLKLFKREHKLADLELNDKTSAITQMSISYANKFSFFRLAGRSYPTCHYMGSSSGTMSLSIKSNDPQKFNSIHAYKSASNFFLRTQDRLDRFNGWEIDSFMTKIFNNNDNQIPVEDGPSKFTSAWYPTQIVSKTNEDAPSIKDISIVFKETNPDFFSKYGFTVYRKGYNLERLRKFFLEIFERAEGFRDGTISDSYSHLLIFGEGSGIDESFAVVNSESLVAAFYETSRFNSTGYLKQIEGEESSLQNKLYNRLKNDPLFSGELGSAVVGLDALATDVSQLWQAITPGGVELNDTANPSLADAVAKRFFTSPSPALIKLVNDIPSVLGRRKLYEYMFSNTDVKFTEDFKEALFAAIVKRRIPPVNEHQYNILGVVSAFSTLTIGIEAKGHEILSEENSNALSQSKKDETKIFLDLDGIKTKSQTATSYPDFFKITYEELFNINANQEEEDSLVKNSIINPSDAPRFPWESFLPTFQDLGIMNSDPKSYENGFNQDSVRTAQDQPITDGESFVPPSVFFYHERKLPKEVTDQLDKQSSEYFQKLKTLRLNLPFDIEKILIDQEGRSTGIRENSVKEENKNNRTLATIIEDMVKETYNKVGQENFKKASSDIIRNMAGSYIEQNGLESYEDILSSEDHKKSLRQDVLNVIRGVKPTNTDYTWSKVSVPFLMSSAVGSPVAKWRNLTGITGERMIRSVLKKSIGIDDQHFISEMLTKASTGLDDDITISSGHDDENKTAMLKITQKISDNSESMMRAFPVMRLYLIDYIGPRILVQDNFYGYHAIESIDITIDKNDPALAVIRLADPFHILQGSSYNSEFSNGKTTVGDFVLPASDKDPTGFNILERVKLRTGRAIQIRGGYASDPDNLDVIFTGRIAEVQFGDVVIIAAQGWKSELMGRQVEFELGNVDNSSVKDLVVSSINKAKPAGFGDEYNQKATDMILNLANDLSGANATFNSFIKGAGTAGSPTSSTQRGTYGFSPLGFGIFRQAGRGLDLRLKNIWAPDKDRSRWNYFADISDTGWEGSSWVVPLQTCWETLQQATNYIWGYICQVVPYESEATVFFGRPDQMYNFRTVDSMRYRANRNQRVAYKAELENNFSTIINGFKNTDPYTIISIPSIRALGGEYLGDGGTKITATNNDFISGRGALSDINEYDFSSAKYESWDTWTFQDHVITFKAQNNFLVNLPFVDEKESLSTFEKSLLSKNFQNDLDIITDAIGDKSKACIMLISHFYGLNYEYVQNNFNPYPTVETLMSNLLKGARLESTKAELIDRFKSSKEEQLLEELFIGSEIPFETARTYLEILSGKEAASLERATWNVSTKDIGFSASSIVSEISILDKNIPKRFSSFFNIITSSIGGLAKIETGVFLQILKTIILDQANASKKSPETIKQTATSLRFTSSAIPPKSLTGATLVSEAKNTSSISPFFEHARDYLKTVIANKSPENTSQVNINKANVLAFKDKGSPESILTDKGFSFNSEEDIAKGIIYYLPLFKSFVHFLAQYLNVETLPVNVKEAISKVKEISSFNFERALNMKVFRDYHYVTNKKDIIENNIAASTREMSNTVVIRYPSELETSNSSWLPEWVPFFGKNGDDYDSTNISSETEWTTWPPSKDYDHIGMQFNSNVSLQEKKITVYTDLNCQCRDQCAKVASNILSKSMRPMYRNNLLIIGRVIKPWDIIYLKDDFVDMWGPVEVERVVHHYSVNTGWVTNIIPHAVCDANPGNKYVQTAIFNNKIDKIFNAADLALWILTLATGVPVAKVGLSALTTGVKWGIKEAFTLGATQASKQTVKEASKKGIIPGIRALGRDVGKGITFKEVGEATKLVKTVMGNQGPAFIKSFFWKQGVVGNGLDTLSRVLIQNAGTGKNQLPVTFSPLIFKGIPLEAGLNGDSYSYYSLSSRLHWTLSDWWVGFNDIVYAITNSAHEYTSADTNSREYKVLKSVHDSTDIK